MLKGSRVFNRPDGAEEPERRELISNGFKACLILVSPSCSLDR